MKNLLRSAFINLSFKLLVVVASTSPDSKEFHAGTPVPLLRNFFGSHDARGYNFWHHGANFGSHFTYFNIFGSRNLKNENSIKLQIYHKIIVCFEITIVLMVGSNFEKFFRQF